MYSNIVISVSDGQVSATLPAFSVTVVPATQPNQAPTISGTPATSVSVGQAYSFQPGASDPDGQVLAFGIANKPDWANFDVATGKLTGTPAAADVATYANVVISVSDGAASATLPAFSIVVKAPVIGSAELTWTAPTQNEDGTPLTNLAGYKIRYGSSYGALNQVVDVPNPGITSAVDRGPGRRYLVLHGRLVHQYGRRERPDRGRLQDDPVGDAPGTVPARGLSPPFRSRGGDSPLKGTVPVPSLF